MIHHGDALTVLRTLPEASVHCCITSPPYWGLRDYGTGKWEGGDADCDHKQNHGIQGKTGQRANRTFTGEGVYKDECRKCGAARDDQQIGLEETPAEWIQKMVDVFSEVRRVLRDDGTLWVNIGDSYCSGTGADRLPTTTAGGRVPASWSNRSQPQRIRPVGKLKAKDLCMMPARLAIALHEDGWWLRSDIIWHKPNPQPESVTDRPTKAHEYVYLLAKSESYYYDFEAVKEPVTGGSHARGSGVNPKSAKWTNGAARPRQNESFSAAVKDLVEDRNMRSVWTVPTEAYPEAHFATFPQRLIEPCVIAGCPPGGTILDPFAGAGTTGLVAKKHGRKFIGIELNQDYIAMAEKRLSQEVLDLWEASA